MENFTPFSSEENNKQYYKEVYQYIKWLSEFDENSKYESTKKFYEEKKITANMNKRSAVELLIRHWTFFSPMIYKDYEIWHKRFETLSVQSGKTAELGWRAMKIFYKAIAQVLKNGNTVEERKVFLVGIIRLMMCIVNHIGQPRKRFLFNYYFPFLVFQGIFFGLSFEA